MTSIPSSASHYAIATEAAWSGRSRIVRGDSALVLLPTRRGKRSNDAVTEHCSELCGE